MIGRSAGSAGTRARVIALALAFCALAVGPGCERETFDLLDVAGTAGVAGMNPAQAGGGAAPDTFAGGGNGNELAGSAGRPNLSHGGGGGGGAGAGAGGGAGGWQGGFGGYACLPGQPCMTGNQFCPPTLSSCVRCDSVNDCKGTDSQYCFTAIGRCVQCRPNQNDCGSDQVCYPVTYRCVPRCQTSSECVNDHERPVCDSQLNACVECLKDPDCHALIGRPYCAFDSCVECNQSNDQVSPSAAQCPADKPYCVALHCQSKPR